MDTKEFVLQLFENDPGVRGEIPVDARYIKGHSTMTGFHHDENTKRSMSESRKKFYEDHPEARIMPKHWKQREIRVHVSKKEAQKLYNTGMTLSQVANHYGCSVNKIVTLGIKTRGRSGGVKLWWDNRKAA